MKSQTTEAAAGASGDLIPIKACQPNPWNKARPVDNEFKESIRSEGVLQAILVRPNEDYGYEIVCGERRWRACTELDTGTIPAVVREMTDEQVRRAVLIENTHRAAMDPMQQAELIAEYLQDGLDVAAIAAATGWGEGLVRRRAKLLDLAQPWKELFEAGAWGWSVRHFELIARYEHSVQLHLYGVINEWDAKRMDLPALEKWLASETKLVKSAPWKSSDETLLPAAGSCDACIKRSSCQPTLFEEADGGATKEDRCTDPLCWDQKSKAHVARREVELREKHPNLIKVAKEYMPDHPEDVLAHHQFEPAKKSDKGAVPALVVAGKGEGQLTWVKPDKPASSARASGSKGEEKVTTLADRKAAIAKRRNVWILKHLGERLEKADHRALKLSEVVPLVIAFGTVRNASSQWHDGDPWKKAAAIAAGSSTAEQVSALWKQVADVIAQRLKYSAQGSVDMKDAKKLCELLDLDMKDLETAAREEIPDPKSWAKLEEEEKAAKKPRKRKDQGITYHAGFNPHSGAEFDGMDDDEEVEP